VSFGRKTIIAALMTGTNAGQPSNVRGAGPNGTFTPNEDPAHEATESAAREAQEDAGQVPTIP